MIHRLGTQSTVGINVAFINKIDIPTGKVNVFFFDSAWASVIPTTCIYVVIVLWLYTWRTVVRCLPGNTEGVVIHQIAVCEEMIQIGGV